MKKLSREEMKNVVGGRPPVGGICNIPSDCGVNNCDTPSSPTGNHWDCRNHICTFDPYCI
jgi:hypothetical protein